MTRAEAIIAFNSTLQYTGPPLPEGVHVMNPFLESAAVPELSAQFYRKYYSDDAPRKLILGINPGRFGSGATGIPFTDTKRLRDVLGIAPPPGVETHEPSSVFVYEVVGAYGGPEAFYGDFYIHSVCPLGFTYTPPGKRPVNYNYYDDRALQEAVTPFIVWNIQRQIELAGDGRTCYCLGMGKNFQFLQKLNARHGFFARIVPIEHPRFIMQYRAKRKAEYVQGWLDALCS